MGLRVYSAGYASLNVMPIHGKKNTNKRKHISSKPRSAQMIILSLVAVTGLEKKCIMSSNLQWLFHLSMSLLFYLQPQCFDVLIFRQKNAVSTHQNCLDEAVLSMGLDIFGRFLLF